MNTTELIKYLNECADEQMRKPGSRHYNLPELVSLMRNAANKLDRLQKQLATVPRTEDQVPLELDMMVYGDNVVNSGGWKIELIKQNGGKTEVELYDDLTDEGIIEFLEDNVLKGFYAFKESARAAAEGEGDA